jgi:hypothetical protein
MGNRVNNETARGNGHDTGRRDWLADVWIVADLETFEREVRSLLTDGLDTVAAAAVRLMERRDQDVDEPLPPSVHLVEVAAASDPILGSGQLSAQAADLLGYLIALVAGKITGGYPVCWRELPISSAELLGAGVPFLGLAAETRCFRILPTLPEDSLDSLVAAFGWQPLVNLVALCRSVDGGTGKGGMIFNARSMDHKR